VPLLHPLWLAIDLFVALILIRAAIGKARDLAAFEGALDGYRLLPFWSLPTAKIAFPVLEAAIAAGLLIPPARALAGYAGAGLLILFAVAIAINLARGRREIDCGCGGPGSRQTLSWGLVIRNLLIALALVAAALLAGPDLIWSAIPLAAVAAGSAFLLYLGLETLAALPRRAGPKQGLLEMTHGGVA
jgi:hypothetical protein